MAGSRTVVVVGGGPSGLAAAHRLERSGVSARILEAGDRVGGKMRTTQRDGFVIDEGAFFVPTKHTTLLALAREIGMADEIVPGGFVLAIARDGVVHELDGNKLVGSVLKTQLLSTRAKLELVKLAPELWRSRRASYQRMPETGRYDTETLQSWAAKHLSPELQEFLVETTIRGIYATSGKTSSHVDFLAILALLSGAKLVAFRGGMGSYAQRLGRDIKTDLGASVSSVERDDDGVSVTWRDNGGLEHVERADGCVVAVGGAVASRILPGLDDWRREFLGRVRTGRTFVLNVGLSRSPEGISATYIQVPESTHPYLTGILLDHHKAPGRAPAGKGLLTLAVLDSWSEANWESDDAEITALLVDALEQVLPGVRADIEFTELRRWTQEYNEVGFYRDLDRFRSLCSADRTVQLAGELHSMGNLDAATTSGIRAAERLLPFLH